MEEPSWMYPGWMHGCVQQHHKGVKSMRGTCETVFGGRGLCIAALKLQPFVSLRSWFRLELDRLTQTRDGHHSGRGPHSP